MAGTDDDLLARIVAVVRGSVGRCPRVGLVEASWHVERPTAEARRVEAERWRYAGADVLEVDLVDRDDAGSPAVTEALGSADLVWFAAGHGSALYDRLWGTPAMAAVRHAHERGAAVGGISAGAVVWGVGHLSDYASLGDEEPYPLFGWLHDVVVFPHWFASREARFRQTVRAFPGCRGLAVANGGAVAVRADGQIDVLRQGMGGATHATIRDARRPPRAGAHAKSATENAPSMNAAPDAPFGLSSALRRAGDRRRRHEHSIWFNQGHHVVIAHDVDHVHRADRQEKAPHKLRSDASASVGRDHFEKRDVGGQDPVAERADEPDDPVLFGVRNSVRAFDDVPENGVGRGMLSS